MFDVDAKKVLFLDVDGVLMHQGTIENGKRSREPRDSSFYHAALIDLDCAKRVLRICKETGAVIVLISAWRKHDFQVAGLHRAFIAAGMDPLQRRRLFVGSTPSIGENDRAKEIHEWLSHHPQTKTHVVLDDSIVPGLPQAYPRPDQFGGGLQEATVEDAIRLLGGRDV